eukprot:gene2084-2403_t
MHSSSSALTSHPVALGGGSSGPTALERQASSMRPGSAMAGRAAWTDTPPPPEAPEALLQLAAHVEMSALIDNALTTAGDWGLKDPPRGLMPRLLEVLNEHIAALSEIHEAEMTPQGGLTALPAGGGSPAGQNDQDVEASTGDGDPASGSCPEASSSTESDSHLDSISGGGVSSNVDTCDRPSGALKPSTVDDITNWAESYQMPDEMSLWDDDGSYFSSQRHLQLAYLPPKSDLPGFAAAVGLIAAWACVFRHAVFEYDMTAPLTLGHVLDGVLSFASLEFLSTGLFITTREKTGLFDSKQASKRMQLLL